MAKKNRVMCDTGRCEQSWVPQNSERTLSTKPTTLVALCSRFLTIGQRRAASFDQNLHQRVSDVAFA